MRAKAQAAAMFDFFPIIIHSNRYYNNRHRHRRPRRSTIKEAAVSFPSLVHQTVLV